MSINDITISAPTFPIPVPSIAVKRTLRFEDPKWDDPVNGGKVEADPTHSDPMALARFGINSAFNKMPAGYFQPPLMDYVPALAAAVARYTANYWSPQFTDIVGWTDHPAGLEVPADALTVCPLLPKLYADESSTPQDLANVIFDCMVNPGSVRVVQEGINDLIGTPIDVDGDFGPLTLAAINAVDRTALLQKIALRRWAYYSSITGASRIDRQSWAFRTFTL